MMCHVCLLVMYLLILYRTAFKMPVLFICIIISIWPIKNSRVKCSRLAFYERVDTSSTC